MSWFYEEEEFVDPKEYWGFVYIITDLINNKKYIGKKQFYFKKTKIVKGKRKRFLVDSDWKQYYGSNTELREQVDQFGCENFKRVILKLCKSKSECSYWELKYQMEFDVLMKPDEYYNQWVSVKVSRKHLL